MASIQLKNNATTTLLTAISASDVGLVVAYGDGTLFPSLSGGNWFYLTIEDTEGTYEIVKVTARSGDSMTITRAQEGTTAAAFAAGSLVEMRVTAQSILDAISGNAVTTSVANTFTADQTIDAILNIYSGNKVRWYNSSDANPHGIRNNANVLTWDYNSTDYMTANASGVVSFVSVPLVGAAAVYYTGGTDVAVADGGTGSSTASGARTNLGLVIGTDVLAYDAGVQSIAGLTTAADKMIYTTALDTYAVTDLTSFARTLLDDTSASAARSTLGLGTISTQASNSVSITGGSITGLTALTGRPETSSETTGTLTSVSANKVVVMTGNCTLNPSVFTAPDVMMFYAGSSSRTLTQGAGMTLRLSGTSTTGDRTLAARTVALALVVSATEIVVGGSGVS